MANIPDNAYYYDQYFGACEPCFSQSSALPGNQCVYMDMPNGPDSQDWIVDDNDVQPPDARGCATDEKFDLMMMKCRPRCPGEDQKNGQQFVYAPDNKSGSCQCYNPSMFTWDASLSQCIPIGALEQVTRALQAGQSQQHQAGDPYNACALDAGEYTNCYFPDKMSCLSSAFGDQDAAYRVGANPMATAMKQRAMYEACPYLLCPSSAASVNAQGMVSAHRGACVCVSKKLGERIVTAGAKKNKKKGL